MPVFASPQIPRLRFLLTYKRDKLQDITKNKRESLKEKNKGAHDGDAILDTELYKKTSQQDYVYKRLYGFTPFEVRKFHRVMDLHATQVAAQDRDCSAKYEQIV
ncbi:hypothetical protein BDV25DRAFT_138185 [Aspergillus avenaceus]|uniref:Uncharacterized protein n=1 Tax=Aspergillus avenaceus TaxID=36643 RepID=A0A5N6U0I3_ASPAV|nr:hypothetical protein BDV25DRAFT_138185 [Aspergillus avenaceus]